VADFSSHTPGTFCWAELATTDQRSAVAFYRALLGWDVNEQPIGPGDVYSMFQMRGRQVAAAYTMRADERQMGAPPHWNLYVAVASADETATRAATLGAKVLAPPFDVMDVGRMAVLQDPTGAVIEIWQAKRHGGAGILNEAGALCWSELSTRDTKAARDFYTKLFGWTAKEGNADSAMEYTEFSIGGQTGIGMMPMPAQVPAHVPSYWMPYFQVASCDGSFAKARELGATPVLPPQDISKVGRFTVVTDPQGAMFALFQLTVPAGV
jgi:uncharacterized protein